MPELRSTRVLTAWRRAALVCVCMLPLGGLPAGAWAQSVPAGLRACAAESDPGQRLDCYDRVMKRLSATPARPAAPAAPATPAAPTAQTPPTAAHPAAARSDLPSAPPKQATGTATSAPATARNAQSEPATPHRPVWKRIFGGGTASGVTAHVTSLKRSPNAVVLYLDNGQVWRQVGRASGALTLNAGDEVTIQKHLGSYWLSSRYVSDMKVRLEPQ